MKPTTYLLHIASTLITEPRTRRAETVTTVTTTAGLWSLDPEATRENKTEQRAEAGRGLGYWASTKKDFCLRHLGDPLAPRHTVAPMPIVVFGMPNTSACRQGCSTAAQL